MLIDNMDIGWEPLDQNIDDLNGYYKNYIRLKVYMVI